MESYPARFDLVGGNMKSYPAGLDLVGRLQPTELYLTTELGKGKGHYYSYLICCLRVYLLEQYLTAGLHPGVEA